MNAVQTFEIVLALLALVVALTWTASRVHLPPATALLVGGGLLAFVPGLPPITLDPDLALVLFLPPLLMDSAYFTASAGSGDISPASCPSRSAQLFSRRWSSVSWRTAWSRSCLGLLASRSAQSCLRPTPSLLVRCSSESLSRGV